MDWKEALIALDEGATVKLPDKPSGIRIEMGTFVEVWESGVERVMNADVAPLFKKRDDWEVASWNLAE